MARKKVKGLTDSVDVSGETNISMLFLAELSKLSMQVTICAMRDLELLGKLLIVVGTG